MTAPLDRQRIRRFESLQGAEDGGYMEGSAAERLAEVWELTREVWSLVPGEDPDQPMRRDLVVLIRPKA
jgi:hypothetical protein